MKPQNQTCTAVAEGSREYPHLNYQEKDQHFERSKVKECGLSLHLSDEAIQFRYHVKVTDTVCSLMFMKKITSSCRIHRHTCV